MRTAGKHLPVHFDQRQRFLGQVRRVGSDGGNGVTAIQRLLPRHHVAAVETVVDRGPFLLVLDLGGHLGEIGGRHHGMDAGQCQRLAGIDAANAGVGVGAAQDLAVQHAGQVDVGGVAGAAHDLVGTVVAHRARADDAVVFLGIGEDDVGFVVKHRAATSQAMSLEYAVPVIYHKGAALSDCPRISRRWFPEGVLAAVAVLPPAGIPIAVTVVGVPVAVATVTARDFGQ